MQGIWRRYAWLSLLVAGIGCGKGHETKPATGSAGSGSSAVAPAKPSDISVKHDGKAVPIENVFAKRLPDGRMQLYLGQGGSCDELLSNMFDGKNEFVLIDLRTLLASDGSELIAPGDVYAHGPGAKSDEHSKASIRGELTKGAKVPIDLEVTSQEAKVEAKGTVMAQFCGDEDAPPPAAADAPTMTIAKKAFVIRAALQRGNDIELSDQPRDCSSAQYIGVRLQRQGGTWHLDGTRMTPEVTGDAKGLQVIPAAEDKSRQGHRVMTLSGSDQIGAYSVALAGTVDAIDCK